MMRTLFRTTSIVIMTLLVLILLWRFRTMVGMLVIALIITASLRPIVVFLSKLRIPPSISMLLIYLLGFVTLAGLAILMFPQLDTDLRAALNDFNQTYKGIYRQVVESSIPGGSSEPFLPPPVLGNNLLPGLRRSQVIEMLIGTTSTLVGFLSQLLVVIFVSIYLAVDQLHFTRLWLSIFPPGSRSWVRQVYRDIEESIGYYMRSELIQSALALLVLSGVYWIMGLKYPLLSALIVSIAWVIPLVGGAIALLWVAAAGIMTGWWVMLGALLVTSALLAFLEFWLQPRLYHRDRFGTILVLVLMMILGRAFGLIGLLVAPPLATAFQVVLNAWTRSPGLQRDTQTSLAQAYGGSDIETAAQPPTQVVDEWQELTLQVDRIRQSIQGRELHPSTEHLLERLSKLIDKTRNELEA